MAQIVKLRRSSVSGQKPTNSNLQLGELALNTTDGKVFMAVSGSGGPSVQELVSTNTVNTGSIYITDNVTSSFFTGSFIGDGTGLYNIPLSGVTNLVTVSGSIDSRLDALETLNHSYTGSISGSINGIGLFDYLTFNTSSAPATAPSYSMWANTTDKTVNLQMGNNATLQMGQEMYYPPVVNKSGADLNDGDLVMINPSGVAQGNRISVVKAVGNGTYPADYIVGVLTEDIANNQEGFATWFGYVRNVSKSHVQPAGETWVEGDILYPNPTIHGKMTNVLPTAPALKSTIAAVTSINGNNVTLMVRPNLRGNVAGQHDVNILSGVTNGDLFVRSGSVWTNSKGLHGDYTVTGSLTITQNLHVLGSSSFVYVTSSQLSVSNSFISVNVFEPVERFGGLKIYDSGSSNATASLFWDSLNNHWVYQNASGSNYSGGMFLAGPRNTGSLGDEIGLINGYLPKSVGEDHLDNSIISESNGTITVHGHLTAYSLTGSLDFSNIENIPTLVSSSSQIDITGTTGYSTFSSSIDSSISSSVSALSSSVVNYNNIQDGRLNSIETFTSSYNSGSFTGSFIGDGSQLYNIPASGVTGLNLSQITDGAATASISDVDGFRVNRDSEITGSLNVLNDITGSHLNIGNSVTFFSGSRQEAVTIFNSGSYDSIVAQGDSEQWLETYFRNQNSGSNASTDLVIGSDNGSDEAHYVNLGINSSTYNAGFVGRENDSYLFSVAHDFYIGTIALTGKTSDIHIFTDNSWENPQIHISGSKSIGFNTSSVSDGYVYEFSGSALFDHNTKVKGDLTVLGTITAEEIHTSYVTSSVLYKSGSTVFGNSVDDTHTFSGSILVNDLIQTNRIAPVNGSNVTIESSNLMVPNGGIFSSFNIEASGSLKSIAITGSFITGAFIGNGSQLTDIYYHITGSDVDGNQYDKTFNKLHFDSDTGLNVSESVPGTAFISIGSHFKDIFVSGSPILSATGSDAFEIIPSGGVEITTSITDTNGNGYVKELNISTTTLSSSLNTRIDNITGSVVDLRSDFNSYTSSIDNFTSSVVLANQTSSMSVLSSSYAVTAAFALNVVGGGSGVSDGAYAELNQTTPSTSWTFVHNLGQKYPIFQVFDNTDKVVIPTQIIAVDNNTATITFSSAQSGRVIASLGTGPGGMTQYFASATTWSLNHNMGTDYPIVTVYDSNRNIVFPQQIKSIDGNNVEVYFSVPVAGHLNVAKGGHIISGSLDFTQINLGGSGLISGSGQIANFGYAITGSNTFTGNQVINGTLTVNKGKIGSTCLTLSTGNNQTIFDMYGFDGANFDYVIKNGSNMRGGMIMSVWDGSSVSYNESSTTDLGNTSDVTFYVTNAGVLKTNIASGTWQVEVMYRALKCS